MKINILIGLFLSAVATPLQSVSANESITLMLAPTRDYKVLDAIADNAFPAPHKLVEGDSVHGAISRYCGVSLPHYYERLISKNPTAAPELRKKIVTTDVYIDIPACGLWFDNKNSVTIETPSSVADIAEKYLGSRGPDSIARVRVDNRVLPQVSDDELIPAREIRVPSIFHPVQIFPKRSAEEFAVKLFAALGKQFPGFQKTCGTSWKDRASWFPIVSLCKTPNIEAIGPAKVADEIPPECNGSTLDQYGLPTVEEILQAIRENAENIDRSNSRISRSQPIVLIADTGLVGFRLGEDPYAGGVVKQDHFFTKRYYHRGQRGVGIGARMTRDHAKIPDLAPPDRYQETYKHIEHGTHVFGIATGAALRNGRVGAFSDYYKTMIANVVEGLGERPAINDLTLNDALTFADIVRASIINVSIDSSDRLPLFADSKYPKILIVAASGNKYRALGSTAVYPAVYGGRRGRNVLVVAASNSSGAVTAFSNKGEDYVDLTAPGCRIRSITNIATGSVAELDGTSQAAPYVTMTAALLSYLGLDDPWAIKRRILSSVKFKPHQDDLIFSKGELDILRALRFDRDIVETENETLYGKISEVDEPCSDLPPEAKQLRRIMPNFKANKTLVAYDQADEIAFDVRSCDTRPFTFKLDGRQFKSTDDRIKDIIFRESFVQ